MHDAPKPKKEHTVHTSDSNCAHQASNRKPEDFSVNSVDSLIPDFGIPAEKLSKFFPSLEALSDVAGRSELLSAARITSKLAESESFAWVSNVKLGHVKRLIEKALSKRAEYAKANPIVRLNAIAEQAQQDVLQSSSLHEKATIARTAAMAMCIGFPDVDKTTLDYFAAFAWDEVSRAEALAESEAVSYAA